MQMLVPAKDQLLQSALARCQQRRHDQSIPAGAVQPWLRCSVADATAGLGCCSRGGRRDRSYLLQALRRLPQIALAAHQQDGHLRLHALQLWHPRLADAPERLRPPCTAQSAFVPQAFACAWLAAQTALWTLCSSALKYWHLEGWLMRLSVCGLPAQVKSLGVCAAACLPAGS